MDSGEREVLPNYDSSCPKTGGINGTSKFPFSLSLYWIRNEPMAINLDLDISLLDT